VQIVTVSQLKALKVRLLQSVYVDRQPIGHHVQNIDLDPARTNDTGEPPMSEAAVVDAVCSILLQTPHLCMCTFGDYLPIIPSFLTCLSVMSAAALTYLNVWMKPDTENTFPIFNTLSSLQLLVIKFLEGS
jgi:hypothetical protein